MSPRKNLDVIDFQRSLIHAIHEASPDGILVVDDMNTIVSHNQRFLEIWRLPDGDVYGAHADRVVGMNDTPMLAAVKERVKDGVGFEKRVKELYANPHLNDHSEIELKDGRTLERHSNALYGSKGQYLGRVWFFRDITKRKQTEAALQALALQDPLTGVGNRRFFTERAKQEYMLAKRYNLPLCIAELDIDHFKEINDRYGHAAGDEVLKILCGKSCKLIRKTDVFARIGGEEFAVLLIGAEGSDAVSFAERLRAVVSDNNFSVNGVEISCTVSIGLSARRVDDQTIEDCLRRADRALYIAKEGGRNRVETYF